MLFNQLKLLSEILNYLAVKRTIMLVQINCKKIKVKLRKWSGAIVLSSILWLSWTNLAAASESSARQRHILSRLSFGATSAEIEQINQMGSEAYIQAQLEPQTLEESPILEDYLDSLKSVNREGIEIQKQLTVLNKRRSRFKSSEKQWQKLTQKIRKLRSEAFNEAMDAHLARAIYSERQLQEVMVDFWFNHFNVNAQKGEARIWINDYENQIRKFALGNFYDLLLATAKHPAMSIYLDNQKNTAPESPVGKKSERGLNENYARELMELHTMGVDGGYSQDDVIALARILTGWGIDRWGEKGDKNGFFFFDNRHDNREKLFLGHKIVPSGIEEGEQALSILVDRPATARFISYKLAQYFVADEPPESLVDRLATEFSSSRGNIKLVMDTLIHSQEFNDPQYFEGKFTTPYQYLVSLIRMGEIEQPNFKRIRGMLFQLSMPIYQYSTPNGYANTKSAWLNPQAILQRTSFATAISNGTLNRESKIVQSRLKQNLGEISVTTNKAVFKTRPFLQKALMMGSPEAMYR